MQNMSTTSRRSPWTVAVPGRSARRRASAARRNGRAARLSVEGLEGRQLLSVGLDPAFGWGGVAAPAQPVGTATVSVYGSINSLAAQNGKIVTVGTAEHYTPGSGGGSGTDTYDLYVSRLNADGSPDTSFGTNGYQSIAVASAGVNYDVNAKDLVVQPDGKIVALGTASPRTGSGVNDFVVARFNANGSIDTSFGTGGFQLVQFSSTAAVPAPINSSAAQLALAPNGAIVAVGNASPTMAGDQDFAIARLTSTGALDTSFHATGMTTVGFDLGGATGSNDDSANGVVVQPDGKIVVVGSADLPNITVGGSTVVPDNIAVARLNTDGSLDTSFNGTGKLNFGYDLGGGAGANGQGEGVALAGGQILVVGQSYLKYGDYSGPVSISSVRGLTVTALNASGGFDTSFNGTGKYALPLGQGGANWSITASAIAVEPTGNILVLGNANTQSNSSYGYQSAGLLAELTPSGALNSSYGNGGVALLGSNTNSGDRLVIDSSGKALFSTYNGVARTTAPAPQAVSADAVTKGGSPKAPVTAVSMVLNTDVDPKLVTNKKNFKVRIGTKGKRFVKVRKVTYDAATHTLTLLLSKKIPARQAAKGLQVIVSPGTIVGLDGQPFNAALPIAVRMA